LDIASQGGFYFLELLIIYIEHKYLLCLSEYFKYSGLAEINVTVVLGEIIEPIKIVFMGIVTGSPLGHPGLPLEPLLIIMALLFLSASL
jgi:hypothetical protein